MLGNRANAQYDSCAASGNSEKGGGRAMEVGREQPNE
jgi:hypothetical protein